MPNFAAQRQIVASIAPVIPTGYTGTIKSTDFKDVKFTQISGGEITAAVEKVYLGGELFPETLCAPPEVGDITLTNFYPEDETTRTLLRAIRQVVGRFRFNITVNVYNCDIADPKADRYYGNALLVGFTDSDGDASSGTPATYALTFSISSIAPDVAK
jgi:hypothetical protein